MLEPSEPKRGWAIFAVSLIGAGLMLLAGRWRGRRRALALVVALIPLLALMFLAGRVANELLLPTNWGELAGGISRGISDLPGVRVPYRGLDQWVRTVIPLGGSFLVLLAAVLAFFPRRKPGRLGFRWAALLVLLTLFVVPVDLDRLLPRVRARRGADAAGRRLRDAREGAPAGRARRARPGAARPCSWRWSSRR